MGTSTQSEPGAKKRRSIRPQEWKPTWLQGNYRLAHGCYTEQPCSVTLADALPYGGRKALFGMVSHRGITKNGNNRRTSIKRPLNKCRTSVKHLSNKR